MDSQGAVNAISLELCVLSQLRDRIRARDIRVEGADRDRNPDEDLPADFAERRARYYADRGRQQDARSSLMEPRLSRLESIHCVSPSGGSGR